MISLKNIFGHIPENLEDEYVEKLVESNKVKIEKIVSHGHKSPEDFWYDQDENEFVILIRGEAELLFEGGEKIGMRPGDYLEIPAHKKHRVEWTDPDQFTYWLAVFY
jgi:cupin 2 domain-containing protein